MNPGNLSLRIALATPRRKRIIIGLRRGAC